MKIAEREEQIIRIQSQSRYAQINQALQEALQTEAIRVTQSTVEAALVEVVPPVNYPGILFSVSVLENQNCYISSAQWDR
jgi:hypothetical protein